MLFIHIGFHKTGTSTLQYFASANAEALAENNIIYPKIGRFKSAHFNLTNELRNRTIQMPELGGLADLADLIRQNPNVNYLISSEAFHTLNSEALENFRSALPPVPVKVLAYIRELSSWTVSAYFQVVKTGNYVDDFDKFFNVRMGADTQSDIGHVGFKQLENWAKVFGWNNLRVRAVDSRHLAGGDLVEDFLDALGLSWRDMSSRAEETPDRNVSPGWKAVELVRYVQEAASKKGGGEKSPHPGKAAQMVHKLSEEIAQELGLNAERGLYLTEAHWETCNLAYGKMRARLNALLDGPPIPAPEARAFTPRPFLPEVSRVPIEDRAAFFERLSLALAGRLRSERSEGDATSRRQRLAEREETRQTRKSERAQERQSRKTRKQDQKTHRSEVAEAEPAIRAGAPPQSAGPSGESA